VQQCFSSHGSLHFATRASDWRNDDFANSLIALARQTQGFGWQKVMIQWNTATSACEHLAPPWRRSGSCSGHWLCCQSCLDIPSTRIYLLRRVCVNFLGNGLQADGEWPKLRSVACTRMMACSFVSSTHDLIYLKKADCKEDSPVTLPLWTVRLLLTVENSDVN
jgi:hypothetical protein